MSTPAPPDVRQRLFGTSRPLMWGIRNRIAHGDPLVSSDIVRQTVEIDLPGIAETLRRELDR